MKHLKAIGNVTYPLINMNLNQSLIGIKNEIKILNSNDEVINFSSSIFENQLCKIDSENLFYRINNDIYKMDFSNLKTTLFYSVEPTFNAWIFNDDFIFKAKKTDKRREYEFSLIEINSNKIKWSDKSTIRFVSKSNDYLFFTDFLGGIYKRRNIENGTDIWSLDFSENRINGNVLLTGNLLVFPTTSQDLIGIEIETGKEIWRLKNINASHFQIQLKTNYLICLVSNSVGDNWYYVIDPKTGQKILDKKFNNFFFGAGGTKSCITETHYYFISNEYGYPSEHRIERITHLGCINLQSHEIEWVEKIGTTPDRRCEYQKPEIHNGKIYLLDGEQTLHIYEVPS